MRPNPELWEDFRKQISGQAGAGNVAVQPENKKPEKSEENREVWYRVGSGWKGGICQKQTGAYHNRDFAIADCKPGQNVYDEQGNVIYSGDDRKEQNGAYTQKQFILDVQKATAEKKWSKSVEKINIQNNQNLTG